LQVAYPLIDPRLHHTRRPDLRTEEALRSREAFRRKANDSEGMIVQDNRLSDDAAIATEPLLPAVMTQHHHWMRAGRAIFFRRKGTSDGSFDPEHVEVVARDEIAPDALIVASLARKGA